MSNDLHDISFKLGEISGSLESINGILREMKEEAGGLVSRVGRIEEARSFESGAHAQNKKIAAIMGGVAGIVASNLSSLFHRFFQ